VVTTRFSSPQMPRNPWSKAKNSFLSRFATLCDNLSHIDVRSTLLKCAILAHELFHTAIAPWYNTCLVSFRIQRGCLRILGALSMNVTQTHCNLARFRLLSQVYKRNRSFCTLMLLLLLVSPLASSAQQARPNPSRLAEIRAMAERGDPKSQFALAHILDTGDGVQRDYAAAFKWYLKAAENGHALSQHMVGEMYRLGQGVARNDTEAANWFRRGAENGESSAQVNIGAMYYHGQGVPQDYISAARWYRKSAEQGNPGGQCNLGGMYQYGKGVQSDFAEAVKWYRKAALQNWGAAQSNLGVMYATGKGVAQDDIEAYKWFTLAIRNGDKSGARNRDFLAKRMLPSQIQAGTSRAEDFSGKRN
jgi:TPR repeat protein